MSERKKRAMSSVDRGGAQSLTDACGSCSAMTRRGLLAIQRRRKRMISVSEGGAFRDMGIVSVLRLCVCLQMARRRVLLLLYLMRSPIFEMVTK